MAEQEFGEVIAVEGPIVKVRIRPQSACAACGQKGVCFAAGKYRILIARAQTGIHEGDMVSIDFPSGSSIISSLLIFVGSVSVPLTAWLIAELAKAPLWLRVASAAAALLVYWVFLISLNRRLKRSGWFLPRAEKTKGGNQEPAQ